MKSSKGFEHIEGLHAEFASWNQNQPTKTVHLSPSLSVKTLDKGNQIGKSLAWARSRTAHKISSIESMRNWSPLNFGHFDEFRLEKTAGWNFRKGKILKSNLDFLFVSSLQNLMFLRLDWVEQLSLRFCLFIFLILCILARPIFVVEHSWGGRLCLYSLIQLFNFAFDTAPLRLTLFALFFRLTPISFAASILPKGTLNFVRLSLFILFAASALVSVTLASIWSRPFSWLCVRHF